MTTWYLRRHGGARISLSIGGYDKHLDADLKSTLPGPIRYDTNRSMWLFPLMWEDCVGLRPLADKRHATLEIGPRLASWARRERNRAARLPSGLSDHMLIDMGISRSEAEGFAHVAMKKIVAELKEGAK